MSQVFLFRRHAEALVLLLLPPLAVVFAKGQLIKTGRAVVVAVVVAVVDPKVRLRLSCPPFFG